MRGALVALALFAASAGHAQFKETIEVKLVEIDVVVTDKDGKRVHGLKPEDFEVFEGRAKQAITNFAEYGPAAGVAPSPAAPAVASAPSALREPQNLLVLMEPLPREKLIRSRTFEQLDAMLVDLMRDGDRVSVVLWMAGYARASTLVESVDRDTARRALDELARKELLPDPAGVIAEQWMLEDKMLEGGSGQGMIDTEGHKRSTEFFSGEMALMAFRRKTRALTRILQTLGAGPGRKTLLFVTSSFRIPQTGSQRPAYVAAVDEVVKMANAGGVTFYGVNPLARDEAGEFGARIEEIEALRQVTLPTGGLFETGPGSLAPLATSIAEDASSYYSLAYQARSDGRDRERKISVRTKNRDYRVRARESFIEKSKETVARDTLLSRLFGGDAPNEIQFGITQGEPKKSGRDRWLVPILVRIPAKQLEYAQEGSERVALVKVLITAVNGFAESAPITEDDLRVVAGKNDRNGLVTYSVELLTNARGSEVSIGVLDRRSGRVGARTIDNRGRFEPAKSK